MSESSNRQFFSGDTLQQALVQAANHFGIDPEEIAYRQIEKKHGFLKNRPRVLIEVDANAPRRERPAPLPPPPPPAREERQEVAEAAPRPEPAEAREARPERVSERAPDRRERPERAERAARPERGDRPARRGPGGDRDRDRPRGRGRDDRRGAGNGPGRDSRGRDDRGRGGDDRGNRLPPLGGERGERGERGAGFAGVSGNSFRGEERRGDRERDRERDRDRPAGFVPRPRLGADEPAGLSLPEENGLVKLPEMPRRPSERFPEAGGPQAEAAAKGTELLLRIAGLDLAPRVLQGEERLEIDLSGDDVDWCFADDGELVLALEHLLPRVIRSLSGEAPLVRVDCDNFQEIREERLRSLAQRVADEVRRRGRPRILEPMNPADRRIVHMTLADDPGVVTESTGEGYFKRVTIRPAPGAST